MEPYRSSTGLGTDIFFCEKCKAQCQHYTVPLIKDNYHNGDRFITGIKKIAVVTCTQCETQSYDLYEITQYDSMSNRIEYTFYRIYPLSIPLNIETPNSYLPQNIIEIYKEAAYVFNYSPRAAATLLRLAMQLLLEHMNFRKKDSDTLNTMIGNAVQAGVPVSIQQAMDIMRYHGNESAHHLMLNPDETKENTLFLFSAINTIAYTLIENPSKIRECYNKIPETIRDSITQRDTNKKQSAQP